MKTLKDIYDVSKQSYISDEADEIVEEIKKAAREWVKLINSDKDFPIKQTGYFLDDLETWITYFFNLEENGEECYSASC